MNPAPAAVSLGNLRKLAEGREAEIFDWGDGNVLRLLRRPGDGEQLRREQLAMEAAAAAGVPVPAVRALVEVEGRPGMVMERVAGTDLLTATGRQPWKILAIGRTTGEVHARLHDVKAPAGLWPLRNLITMRLYSPLVPSEVREVGLSALARLPDGDRLCHGDFHPGNIMGSTAAATIIDWVGATAGDPAADFARTLVLGRASPPPPGQSLVVNALFTPGRKLLMGSYERRYRALAHADLSRVDQWLLVRAAERFADGIPGERPALLRMLRPR